MSRFPTPARKHFLIVLVLLSSFSTQIFAQKVTETTKGGQLSLKLASDIPSVSTCAGVNQLVHLTADAVSPDRNPIQYRWTTPVGKIVGEGASVAWDLSGVAPGQYKASVEAMTSSNDGSCTAFSSTSVIINPCNVATCPKVEISCPTNVVPGQPLVFTSRLVSSGFPNIKPIYNWTVSAGTIIDGQGTNTIRVDTTNLAGQQVQASLNMGGYPVDCLATCAVQIPVPPETCRKFDEFPDIARNDEKARLDNFAVALQNDPSNTGYVIIHPDREGKTNAAQNRNARITDYLVNTRGMDAGRIISRTGPATDGLRVELWICPKGAKAP
jgi:hypothetical protein